MVLLNVNTPLTLCKTLQISCLHLKALLVKIDYIKVVRNEHAKVSHNKNMYKSYMRVPLGQ